MGFEQVENTMARTARTRRDRRRRSRGAAAVEGALIFGFFLVPLVLGLIKAGTYFWHAQDVPSSGGTFSTDSIVGSLTCQQLKARLADLLTKQAGQAGQNLGLTPNDLMLQVVNNAITGVPTVTISYNGVSVGNVKASASASASTGPLPSAVPSAPPLGAQTVAVLQNARVSTGDGSC